MCGHAFALIGDQKLTDGIEYMLLRVFQIDIGHFESLGVLNQDILIVLLKFEFQLILGSLLLKSLLKKLYHDFGQRLLRFS